MAVVLSSAAEAEMGGLFHNGKEGEVIRTTLIEMGHPQPPTIITTDNSTAEGIVNETVKQRRSKAFDMRFYWTRDRSKQGHFIVRWDAGKNNRGDYYTKRHPTSHHIEMRPMCLKE